MTLVDFIVMACQNMGIPNKYVIVLGIFTVAAAVALRRKCPPCCPSDLYSPLPGNSKLGWLLEIPSEKEDFFDAVTVTVSKLECGNFDFVKKLSTLPLKRNSSGGHRGKYKTGRTF